MKIQLTLIGRVQRSNGSLTVEIKDQDQVVYTGEDLPEGQWVAEFKIDWPTTVHIQLSNKQLNDTQLDQNGLIVQDKVIEVTDVLINNFPVHQDLVDKLFVCRREGSADDTNENWWAWNGTVKINFDHASPMRYLLSLQNEFAMNRLEWNTHE
jgi:hypothetical protein